MKALNSFSVLFRCLLVFGLIRYTTQQDVTDGSMDLTGGSDNGDWPTTLETSATTEDDKVPFSKLLAVIVLSTVLGFLLLAVLACACYLYLHNKDRRAATKNHPAYQNQHYNQGDRITPVRGNVYRNRPTFWGTQDAVAQSVDRSDPNRIIPERENIYHDRQAFWGVQDAVAQSLDREGPNQFGYDPRARPTAGFRSGPQYNQGYSPYGN